MTVQQVKSYLDQNLQNAITKQNSDVQEQQVYRAIPHADTERLQREQLTALHEHDAFFNDWSALSTDPTNTADKQTVASDGKTLCTTFNTMYSDLVTLQSDLNGEVNTQIDDINDAYLAIASLNQLIAQGQMGTSQANDYIDQRNQLLQQLSGYMNINCSPAATIW